MKNWILIGAMALSLTATAGPPGLGKAMANDQDGGYVLIISMGMQNVIGGMPSTNSYQELLIPMDSKDHCESKVEDFSGLDLLVNGYQIFIQAECLPGYDYQEPDLETYRDCHESPQSSLPKHCKGVEFLDDSDEQG